MFSCFYWMSLLVPNLVWVDKKLKDCEQFWQINVFFIENFIKIHAVHRNTGTNLPMVEKNVKHVHQFGHF